MNRVMEARMILLALGFHHLRDARPLNLIRPQWAAGERSIRHSWALSKPGPY